MINTRTVGALLTPAPRPVAAGIAVVLIIVLLTVTPINSNNQQARYSTITLAERSDSPSFFERNRDALVMSVLSALLGGALGVAGTLITQAISKK